MIYLGKHHPNFLDQNNIESEFFNLLHKDADNAFKLMFESYYSYLCLVVYRMIPNKSLAEDLVQDVLYDIWRKRERLQINTSLKAYLRKATVNKTLNHIRDKKIKFEEETEAIALKSHEVDILQELDARDLQKKINQAVESLPDRCRIVFSLSRFEEMSYKEIAENLDISVKTVENQMSKALRIMRKHIFK